MTDCRTRVHAHDIQDDTDCHLSEDGSRWHDCSVQPCPHRLTAPPTSRANPTRFFRCTPDNAPGQQTTIAEASTSIPAPALEPEFDITNPIPPDSPPRSPRTTPHPLEDMASAQAVLDALAALTAATQALVAKANADTSGEKTLIQKPTPYNGKSSPDARRFLAAFHLYAGEAGSKLND